MYSCKEVHKDLISVPNIHIEGFTIACNETHNNIGLSYQRAIQLQFLSCQESQCCHILR